MMAWQYNSRSRSMRWTSMPAPLTRLDPPTRHQLEQKTEYVHWHSSPDTLSSFAGPEFSSDVLSQFITSLVICTSHCPRLQPNLMTMAVRALYLVPAVRLDMKQERQCSCLHVYRSL